MRIYVDFDDVLCETARAISHLARNLFGRRVAYDQISEFDLAAAFNLDDLQYAELMSAAHATDFLASLEPTPGAVDTLRGWMERGWRVEIVTGRPFATHPVSRKWLSGYNLADLPLRHLDKYGREHPPECHARARSLTPREFLALRYDLAVEDSPVALPLLAALPSCNIVLFDRPWNRTGIPETGTVQRCLDWPAIDRLARTMT